MNVVLIGLRGSGKTAVGRALAEATGRTFVDLDDLSPRVLGHASVGEAWSACGEERFRQAEVRALADVLARSDQIIALGGGTPMAPGAADLLAAHRARGAVVIVYLACAPEVLRDRLRRADNRHRPPLLGVDPVAEVEAVCARRDPVYRALADVVVATDDTDAVGAAAAVRAAIGLP